MRRFPTRAMMIAAAPVAAIAMLVVGAGTASAGPAPGASVQGTEAVAAPGTYRCPYYYWQN